MQRALSPYAAAGVALATAGAIAISPLAPPAPEIHLPALSSQASVELSAFTNPLDTWASVLAATITNLEVRGQVIINNPAPILRQLIANQMANATTLAGVGQLIATNIQTLLDPSNPDSSVSYLQNAANAAAAGDVATAIGYAYSALWYKPATGIGFPLLGAYSIVNTTMTHLQKFVAAVPGLIVSAGQNFAFGTGGAIQVALSDTAQGLLDAIEVGDIETVASIALNAPAVFVGAALNGYGPYPQSGLLGEYGPVKYAVKWLETAAEAIGKPKPPITFTLQPAVPEIAAAPAVALSTDPAPSPLKAQPAPNADAVATAADSVTTGTAEPAEAATPPAAATPEPAKQSAVSLVRESLVASPGKAGATPTVDKPAAKVASDVRDGISATAKKIGEGVKKAFAKPEKATASSSTGAGKHRAGSGNSGDSK